MTKFDKIGTSLILGGGFAIAAWCFADIASHAHDPEQFGPPKPELVVSHEASPRVLAEWPEYAAVLTDDNSRNRCIIENGEKTRAYRADFAAMGAAICDAATADVSYEREHARVLPY
jgi:hypothetical protein